MDEKVELLRAGQVVEIGGNWFKAKNLPDLRGFIECCECSVDCACDEVVNAICASLSTYNRPYWLLELVCEN